MHGHENLILSKFWVLGTGHLQESGSSKWMPIIEFHSERFSSKSLGK